MAKPVIATIETVVRSFIGSSNGCSRRTISVRWIDGAAEKDRVAVGRRVRDRGRGQRAAGAGLVLDKDRAEHPALADLVGPRPADDVEHAARRKRQHQADRPRWIGVRPQHAGRCGETGGTGRQGQKSATVRFHPISPTPLVILRRSYTTSVSPWRGATDAGAPEPSSNCKGSRRITRRNAGEGLELANVIPAYPGGGFMNALLLPLTARFFVLTSVVVIALILLFADLDGYTSIYVVIPLVLFTGLALLGIHDIVQTRHAVLRNYPLMAHIRFILEEIRPEIRQYFLESEKDGTPFSARQARHRLSARQAGLGQTAVRHAKRRLCLRLRVARPFDGAEARGQGAVPRRHRRAGLQKALFGFDLQYFGDEFWRAQRQRHPGAERRRQERQFRPRHRRRRL